MKQTVYILQTIFLSLFGCSASFAKLSSEPFVLPSTFQTRFDDLNGWNTGKRFLVIDINGDDADDLLARDAFGVLEIWISNGVKLVFSKSQNTIFTDSWGWNDGNRFYVLDINGDNKDDLIARDYWGTLIFGHSNGDELNFIHSQKTNFSDESGWNIGNRFFVMDINGDNKDDFVARGYWGTLIFGYSNGTEFEFSKSQETELKDEDEALWNSGNKFFVMDINGDNRDDLVVRHPEGTFDVRLSDGNTLEIYNKFQTLFPDNSGWNFGNRFLVMDINGDNRDDLVSRYYNGLMEVWLSDKRNLINSNKTCTECAVIYDTENNIKSAFGRKGDKNLPCKGFTGVVCDNDDYDDFYHPPPNESFPWYQEAIYWARENNYKKVVLSSAEIIINSMNKIPFVGMPFENGVGIHIPSNIELIGTNDTSIQLNDNEALSTMILVSERNFGGGSIFNSSVSGLTIVGTSNLDYCKGQKCDLAGINMYTITELDTRPPDIPSHTGYAEKNRYVTGIWVDESEGGKSPVNIHHNKIAHLGTGIAYGWNSRHAPEDPTCQTVPNITFEYTAKGTELCEELYPEGFAKSYPESLVTYDGSLNGVCSVCVKKSDFNPTYCPIKPHEYIGKSSSERAQVYNNSIADVYLGINIAGGYVDVHHNLVVRDPNKSAGCFGLSTDGHLPYSSHTSYYENYVSGFGLGFLTDGSQYVYITDADFEKITKKKPSDFTDYQQVLNLLQIVTDYAQSWFASSENESDWYRGYIDHLTIINNRFYNNIGMGAINLYRVNWAYVAHNKISSQNGTTIKTGIGVQNTINSWIFGNTITNCDTNINVSGMPGFQSHWVSSYKNNYIPIPE